MRQADAREPQAQALHAAVAQGQLHPLRSRPGRSKVEWSGRIGRRALKRGRYVLRATPTDAAGNQGTTRTLSITIVR